MKQIKICGITTRPGTARVMLPTLAYVAEREFASYLICQPYDGFTDGSIAPITYIPVEMGRGAVSPFEVIKCTYKLYKVFRKHKFDIVQYASSNAGLYASIAAWLARVPVRVFCQWGVPYTDYSGVTQKFFKFLEYITCLLSTSVQPDSHLNKDWAVSEGLFTPKKGCVLGKGSAQGVNLGRFNISQKTVWREEIRSKCNIDDHASVFTFVGRIVPQKGVNELLNAFLRIEKKNTFLLIVGAPDEIHSLDSTLLSKAQESSNVKFIGSVKDPERYIAASDFFVLPSYREGFPNTILEAGALGVPSIVTRINGMIDLVKDQETGFSCDVKSADSLYKVMLRALSMNDSEYQIMSEKVYSVVRTDYDSEYIKQCFYENRKQLITERLKITI